MRSFVLFFALFFSCLSFAKTEKEIADSFTQWTNQPTFQEMLDAFGGKLPEKNPFLNKEITSADYPSMYINNFSKFYEENNISYDSNSIELMPNQIARDYANYIAKLELLYPGATWAFLGNDTRLFADPVEAFYLSIGQRDRMAPLLGSGPTIRINDMELLAKFLHSAGFDAKNPLNGPPFIIIDRTSYAKSSQIRHLLKAGYQAYVKNAGKTIDLLTKFNALNSDDSDITDEIISFRDNYFNVQRSHLKNFPDPFSNGENIYAGIPKNILGVEMKALQNRTFWHGGRTYGPIIQDEKGRWVGSAPEQTTETTKRQILAFLYELYQEVSRPEFLNTVQKEARKLGYEFPLQRPDVDKGYRPNLIPIKKMSPREKLNEDVISVLKPLDETVSHRLAVGSNLTPNGYAFSKWLHKNTKGINQTETLIMFLKEITTALESKLITWDDYSKLVITVIEAGINFDYTTFVPIPFKKFDPEFQRLIKKLPKLYLVFSDDLSENQTQWLQKYTHHFTRPQTTNYIRLLIEHVITPLQCEQKLIE